MRYSLQSPPCGEWVTPCIQVDLTVSLTRDVQRRATRSYPTTQENIDAQTYAGGDHYCRTDLRAVHHLLARGDYGLRRSHGDRRRGHAFESQDRIHPADSLGQHRALSVPPASARRL